MLLMPYRFTPLVAVALLAAPSLGAQTPADTTTPWIPRVHVGIAGDYSRPTGAFQDQVSSAGGVQAHVRVRLDQYGLIALRLQGGYVAYGHETQRSCIATTPGCRVEVTVGTSNGILSAGIGPEFSFPLGNVRAYANGLIGSSRLVTITGLSGGILPDIFAADENFGDGGFSWSTGAGFQLALGTRYALDLGVSYQGNGVRDYLIEGGITDKPDGSLEFDVKRSSTNVVAFRLGLAIALGGPKKVPNHTHP
jgi:hypothetical protein